MKRTARKIYNIKGITFNLDARYVPLKDIGQGGYGTVWACQDEVKNRKVAIKKIPDLFIYDDVTYTKRALRELKILRHISHPCIIRLLDMDAAAERIEDFNEIYVVMEIMDTTLRNVTRSGVYTPLHIMVFAHQILCGLKYLHAANIIHRDLKPSNLLVSTDSSIKIIDFGLSRGISLNAQVDEANEILTPQNVTTLWYRAPEVLLGCSHYGPPVDMWALGCIFAELIIKKPLFPGNSKAEDPHLQQLNLITDLLGTPDLADVTDVPAPSKSFILNQPHKPALPIDERYGITDVHAADLLKKMLTFNPAKRITIENALQHPYFSAEEFNEYRDRTLEQFEPPKKFDFNWEHSEAVNSCQRMKEIMWQEVITFRQELQHEPRD
jgi:serine/threonine protein kinase